jgi:site-specific DNA-methyltransferase (adenine-specific)
MAPSNAAHAPTLFDVHARAPGDRGLASAAPAAAPADRPSPGMVEPEAITTGAVLHADAVELLRALPSGSVDLLITDPAYESLEKHRAVGTTTRLSHSKASSNDWFRIFPNARVEELFAEAFRVLKKNTHLYMFCDQETMFVAKPIAERAGFRFWKPLVWDKRKIGMGYHYRSRYELVLFFEKGKRKLADLSVPDILEHARIRGGYPSEKPPEVSEVLVRQSSVEGDLVVDPFCGSGSVGVAARRLGRRFLGGDICAEAVQIASGRVADTSVRIDERLGEGEDAGTPVEEREG